MNVLIVDDEPNIVISLEFLMKKEGFEVAVAGDGEDTAMTVAVLGARQVGGLLIQQGLDLRARHRLVGEHHRDRVDARRDHGAGRGAGGRSSGVRPAWRTQFVTSSETSSPAISGSCSTSAPKLGP